MRLGSMTRGLRTGCDAGRVFAAAQSPGCGATADGSSSATATSRSRKSLVNHIKDLPRKKIRTIDRIYFCEAEAYTPLCSTQRRVDGTVRQITLRSGPNVLCRIFFQPVRTDLAVFESTRTDSGSFFSSQSGLTRGSTRRFSGRWPDRWASGGRSEEAGRDWRDATPLCR